MTVGTMLIFQGGLRPTNEGLQLPKGQRAQAYQILSVCFCQPEAAMLNQVGVILGESTLEVSRMYREKGLSLAEDQKDMTDHVPAELEFMEGRTGNCSPGTP